MDLKQMIYEFRQFQLANRKHKMVVIENVLFRVENQELSVSIEIEPGDNGTISFVPSFVPSMFRAQKVFLDYVETYDVHEEEVVIIRTPRPNYNLKFGSVQLRQMFVTHLRQFLSLSSDSGSGSDGESLDSGRSTLPPQ